jgi:cytidylate kinase
MHRPRSVEEVLEEQARRWQLGRAPHRPEVRGPVVTVSRVHGARGAEVAREVARRMGLRFYDREILSRIAEEAQRSVRRVSPLDERDERSWLSEWLLSLLSKDPLTRYEYGYHLARVLGDIARAGSAVILGRGAHLVLRPDQTLRVQVVAPLEFRVATVAARDGVPPAEARRRVLEVDAGREAYLRLHFPATPVGAAAFDVQVNTEALGVAGAAATVVASVAARFPAVEPHLTASA